MYGYLSAIQELPVTGYMQVAEELTPVQVKPCIVVLLQTQQF